MDDTVVGSREDDTVDVGIIDGVTVGNIVIVEDFVGEVDDFFVGRIICALDGNIVGSFVGVSDGSTVGDVIVGSIVGETESVFVG